MLRALIKTVRPHQWVKNLFVLAPMFFHRDVFLSTPAGPALNLLITGQAVAAMAVFCLLAGAVYTINDLADATADRIHPIKRFRPIARGEVTVGAARILAPALVTVSLALGSLLSWQFAAVAMLYFAENLLYTFRFKKVAFLDVSFIAFGFVLRVVGGGVATGVHPSGYMLACTALLALFLGFGKRRYEIESEHADKHRAALRHYTAKSLDVALAITGSATAATYVAYTLDPATRAFFQSNSLWLTIPFTVFGILRFVFLASGKGGKGLKSESPTQEMLHDVPFVVNLVAWVAVVVAIVYRLRPSA